MLNDLGVKDWLVLNAQLQKKKQKVRKALKELGVLARGQENKFDHYKYFSEAHAWTLRSDSEMERNPEVPASTRDKALFYCTKPSGVRSGPSQLHSIPDFSEAP